MGILYVLLRPAAQLPVSVNEYQSLPYSKQWADVRLTWRGGTFRADSIGFRAQACSSMRSRAVSTALERPGPDGTAAVPRVHACDGVLLRGKGFGPKLSDLEWSGKRLQSLPGAVLTAVHTSVMFVVASGTGCTHK